MTVDLIHRLIGLVALVFVLARLSAWISIHLQGLAFLLTRSQNLARFFIFLVLAPGVFIHELSHWLMAKLLGVPVGNFRVWPKRTRGGNIQMGAVEVRGAGPVSLAFIGIAPFLVGTLALILLGGWLQTHPENLADWRTWFSNQGWDTIQTFFHQNAWPWRFYAIWLISNSMMPSPSDRDPLYPLLGGFFILIVMAYFAGLTPNILGVLYSPLLTLFDMLAGAFLLAVIGNAVVASFLLLLERTMSFLLGVHVEYN